MPHPDIAPLLWYGDGEHKNWTNPDWPDEPLNLGGNTYELAHTVYDLPEQKMIWEYYDNTREPSAIYFSLPIRQEEAPPMPGYPRWYRLTPGQRWKYLQYLENPYQPVEIGYMFLLYYGLERHLYFGDYKSAVPIVFRLRGIANHPSLWFYSSNALLISAYRRNDVQTMQRVLNDFAKNKGDFNLCMFAHSVSGIPLRADEVVSYRRKFGFRNDKYMRTDPMRFIIELKAYMEQHPLPFNSLGDATGWVPAAANWTLFGRWFEVPDFTQKDFVAAGKAALQFASNQVKEKCKPS